MKPIVACPPFSVHDFLADCREHEIGLRVEGGQIKVKFGLYRPSLDLIEWIRANKLRIIAAIQEEEARPTAPNPEPVQEAESVPASEAEPEPPTLPEPEAVTEPPTVRGVAQEPEPSQTVLVVGATAWPSTRAAAIRDRLNKLPIETTVLILGDTESRTKQGALKGAAAIAWATCAALGLEIEQAEDVEAALQQAEAVLAFHPQITMSRVTGQVVDRAKALGRAVEVITGRPTELPTKGGLERRRQKKQEVGR